MKLYFFSNFRALCNGNAVADVEQLVPDEDDNDFIDADHGTAQLPNNKEAATASSSDNMVLYADHSSQTGLRFVLNSRTRTVMGLLEKMFET